MYDDFVLVDDLFFDFIPSDLPIWFDGFGLTIFGEEAPPASDTTIQTWG